MVNTTRGDALVDERFVQGDRPRRPGRPSWPQAPVPTELRQLSDGRDIAQRLETVAREIGADLIVIGLRRRSPVGKLILGSAASRILLSVSVPVLGGQGASSPPTGVAPGVTVTLRRRATGHVFEATMKD